MATIAMAAFGSRRKSFSNLRSRVPFINGSSRAPKERTECDLGHKTPFEEAVLPPAALGIPPDHDNLRALDHLARLVAVGAGPLRLKTDKCGQMLRCRAVGRSHGDSYRHRGQIVTDAGIFVSRKLPADPNFFRPERIKGPVAYLDLRPHEMLRSKEQGCCNFEALIIVGRC